MSTVRETIETEMRNRGLSSYLRQAEPVIAAAEAREHEAVDALIEFATSQGLGRDQARNAITEAGLQARALASVSNGSAAQAEVAQMVGEVQDAINRLQGRLDELSRTH